MKSIRANHLKNLPEITSADIAYHEAKKIEMRLGYAPYEGTNPTYDYLVEQYLQMTHYYNTLIS